MDAMLLVSLVLGLALGFAVAWWVRGRDVAAQAQARTTAESQLSEVRSAADGHLGNWRAAMVEVAAYKQKAETLQPLADRVPQLSAEVAALKATQAERDDAHARQLQALREEFQRLAGEALTAAQKQFAEQAEETLKAHREATQRNLEGSKAALGDIIKPVSETLTRYQAELKGIEEARQTAYGSLQNALSQVAQGQQAVREEAARLATALRSSGKTSGAWGEAQLRNVLELGGLREGIDFTVQASVTDDEGRMRRPDAIIRLPGGRELVVDSKCSLNDYLEAAQATCDDSRRLALARHAAAVRAHAAGLSAKAYWNEFARSADFVVMFLPGENFLSAALEHDLDLMSNTMEKRVLLTGPTNLLALAKTVAIVWKQETLAEQARAIGDEAAALYAGLSKMSEHVGKLGKNLTQTVDNYNEFIGSLERNVLPKARRLPEMGVDKGKRDLTDLRPIDTATRLPVAPELIPPRTSIANDEAA